VWLRYLCKKENAVRCIEVKTMKNKLCSITITKKEYEVAHGEEHIDNYWFYILVWDNIHKDNLASEIYIFKDLLGLIGLRNKSEVLFKGSLSDDNETLWTHNDFSLQLSECVFNEKDGSEKVNTTLIEEVKKHCMEEMMKIQII